MNKQDKLFDLLKRTGWEQIEPHEGVSYLFRKYEYYEDNAYTDCYYASGMIDGLGGTYRNFLVKKEGPYYAAYLEF